jgi:coiled-coil domain-containing protein 130
VRFNAEKKKVGNYHSTPVYSFRMKHTVCGGWIEIRTDPQNTAYVVVEGGRKRDTGDDKEAQPGEIVIRPWGLGEQDPAEKDPFAKLEGKVEDKQRAQTESRRILELQERQNRDWEDPYEKSRRLRRSFRTERKGLEKAAANRAALQDKMSLGIELVDETEADRQRAGLVDFGDDRSDIGAAALRATRTRPMFETSVPEKSTEVKSQKAKRSSRETKAGRLAAQHKASLRHELSGNTRAVVDPFLSDIGAEEDVWKPGVKRRKTASSTPGSQRIINLSSKTEERDHTPKSETGSITPGADSPGMGISEDAPSKTALPMLVGYTSDSE